MTFSAYRCRDEGKAHVPGRRGNPEAEDLRETPESGERRRPDEKGREYTALPKLMALKSSAGGEGA